jgi:hypothetical protein
MPEVFTGTTIKLKVTLAIPTEGAGVAKILFKRPDNTADEWVATVADATSGLLEYTTAAGDLDQPGTWKLNGQWLPTSPPGVFTGKTVPLEVKSPGDC